MTAAAVCFCAQVVEKRAEDLPQTYHHLVDYQWFIQNKLKVTPRLCQEILTGTLEDFGTSKSKELFGEANGLPKHSGTKGAPGPLVTGGSPSSANYHMKLLKHVCHDECENLVEETTMNIDKMTGDVQFYATPFEQTCADKVVRKLEAQILGCCARSCHYGGKSCLAWPSCHQGQEGRLVGGMLFGMECSQ